MGCRRGASTAAGGGCCGGADSGEEGARARQGATLGARGRCMDGAQLLGGQGRLELQLGGVGALGGRSGEEGGSDVRGWGRRAAVK
jgi:hypothetical protein